MRILKGFGVGLVGILVVAAVAAVSVFFLSSRRLARSLAVAPVELAKGDAARGRRLVSVRLGCVECHGADLAGAKVAEDPAVGRIYGPNITPTALKDWTDGELARAIRHAVGRDGRPLVLMPSHDYRHLSKKDLADVVAFVRSVPPVDRPTVSVRLGPLFRALLVAGKLPTLLPAELIDHAAPFEEAPAEAPTKEFGHYLSKLACAGCHGPELSGGPVPAGDPSWPPASSLRPEALDGWTEEDFIKTLRTGVNPSGSKLRAPMPVHLTAQYTDVELKALRAYLQSLEKTESF